MARWNMALRVEAEIVLPIGGAVAEQEWCGSAGADAWKHVTVQVPCSNWANVLV